MLMHAMVLHFCHVTQMLMQPLIEPLPTMPLPIAPADQAPFLLLHSALMHMMFTAKGVLPTSFTTQPEVCSQSRFLITTLCICVTGSVRTSATSSR